MELVSIVIASAGRPDALEPCLAALQSQRERTEVIVSEARRSPPELRERFPWARFSERPGALVPALWSDGIDRSSGAVVALTISIMVPAADWVDAIRAQHRRHQVVGGAIAPGAGLRLSDWAEYFCRYSSDMPPFEGHRCMDLPGDNAAYRRELLEGTRDLYRDGFWEPVVHRRLAEEGVVLWHAPELVVTQGRSGGARAFARQRLVHGRAHGGQRGRRFGRRRNLAGVLGAPLVPPLLTARILGQVARKGRHRARALLALPLILLFNCAWAAGEARGHLGALRGDG